METTDKKEIEKLKNKYTKKCQYCGHWFKPDDIEVHIEYLCEDSGKPGIGRML